MAPPAAMRGMLHSFGRRVGTWFRLVLLSFPGPWHLACRLRRRNRRLLLRIRPAPSRQLRKVFQVIFYIYFLQDFCSKVYLPNSLFTLGVPASDTVGKD